MSFVDDKNIATQEVLSDGKAELAGSVKVDIKSDQNAPLEKSKFIVMLELTGAGFSKAKPGLDPVMVLDVSPSMLGDDKFEKMKIGTKFVIKKLSPIDCLSIVTFAADAERLFRLSMVTKESHKKFEDQVQALVIRTCTNIIAGLETGVKVLNERNVTSRCVATIMRMSDGNHNGADDPSKFKVKNYHVYTFGFDTYHNPKVLNAIACNSLGGTFSEVGDLDNLSLAFSECVAGPLTVVTKDLTLTIMQDESTIKKVSIGNYTKPEDIEDGSVTIPFGDLYNKEIHNITMTLCLTEITSEMGSNVLDIEYTYRVGGKLFPAEPLSVPINRTKKYVKREIYELMIEEKRCQTAMITKAIEAAEDNKLEVAKKKINKAQTLVYKVDFPNPLIEMLKFEIQQLLRLLKTEHTYKAHGHSLALSFETSYNRQRYATRGDAGVRLYSTPHIDKYLNKAKLFEENPNNPLPTEDKDEKEELATDPFGPIARAFSYHIQTAIRSVVAIDNIINKSR
ncbi:LOW QUALITY PROTEIN: von Willebrand factor, type A [Parasponia andersonii]|uniref:von Willebrand factor, type A n=1 Tax=Parasponia andersonii TaxID=3476 RepID=A0A2P5B8A4_PARAD|nr:LOW QUALITY PROTEIN: von Willebrand factor, type A [Parasponia andersonii]